MAFGGGRARLLAIFVLGGLGLLAATVQPAFADGLQPPGYDVSWPQCTGPLPERGAAFAIVGLNGGRPFTTNDCFEAQYRWATTIQARPDVYINLDFPRPGWQEAADGPYGTCAASDDWCHGYNYGYALAKDAILRSRIYGVAPTRYWLDVETMNHWSAVQRNNAQVVRGALDYLLDFNIPIGVYGTAFQWSVITGNYQAPGRLPLWVAGAEDGGEALARCQDSSFAFSGGEIWMVQYPEGGFDGNVRCSPALAAARPAPSAHDAGGDPVGAPTIPAPAPPPPTIVSPLAYPVVPSLLFNAFGLTPPTAGDTWRSLLKPKPAPSIEQRVAPANPLLQP